MGPYALTVTDGKKCEFKNVMLGDVWFCSGQSNMEMPVAGWGKIKNYEEEIANSANKNIRLLEITDKFSYVPASDVTTDTDGWQVCGPGKAGRIFCHCLFFRPHAAARAWMCLSD